MHGVTGRTQITSQEKRFGAARRVVIGPLTGQTRRRGHRQGRPRPLCGAQRVAGDARHGRGVDRPVDAAKQSKQLLVLADRRLGERRTPSPPGRQRDILEQARAKRDRVMVVGMAQPKPRIFQPREIESACPREA